MAFLIPDNMRSREGVPPPIRRVAGAFAVGLDESVSVWFDPPFDPSGERPHFVLLFPSQGVAIVECINWGAAEAVRSGDGSRAMEVDPADPLPRAAAFAERLRTRIVQEPRTAGVGIAVGYGAAFPSLTREEATHMGLDARFDLARCLFKDDIDRAIDGDGETVLLRTFTAMLRGGNGDIGDDHVDILRGLIQPDLVIDGLAGVGAQGADRSIFLPPEGGDDLVRVMDRRQEALAKGLGDGHRIVRGVAGSGKTLVLLFRARLLGRLLPGERVLVTCFTRTLAGQLRGLLADTPNVEVMHLDRVMANLIREARLRHPGFKDVDEDAVAQTALLALDREAGVRYRAVLVDEAQDFSTAALRVCVGLVEPDGDLVVVADAAQNIFRRRFSWRHAGIQAQGRTRILRVNYRNTREILAFASAFLLGDGSLRADELPDVEDEGAVIPPESAARGGPVPELVVVDSIEEEVERAAAIANEWAAEQRSARSTAILYAASREGRVERAFRLDRTLRQGRAPHYWLSNPKDPASKDRLSETEAPIVVSTIHSAKGLEFPRAVLCGTWSDRDDETVNRKLAYVGMTRAMDRLTVVVHRGNPLLESLRAAAVAARAGNGVR